MGNQNMFYLCTSNFKSLNMEKHSQSRSRVISFSRWSRKSYAVFNSLGKVIRIAVLCLVSSILVLPCRAQENRDTLITPETISGQALDEVVVSAQLGPVVQSQLMRVVQVISRAEIEQSPVRDLAGLLESVRGIDIRKRGTFGMQADISIRGGTFDQTLILINGINITDPQTGHHNLNVPVDPHSIERIEILQGAGARIFGPNAFNGAVNIITKGARFRQHSCNPLRWRIWFWTSRTGSRLQQWNCQAFYLSWRNDKRWIYRKYRF
jgi:vitamin B12 transporter